jgi:hypothetical protein
VIEWRFFSLGIGEERRIGMSVDGDVAVARAARLAYWQEDQARAVVEAWRRSGESLAAFGRRYGIAPRRVSWWARRLAEVVPPRAVSFYPVHVVGSLRAESVDEVDEGDLPRERIEIRLSTRDSVFLPRGFAPEELRLVLRELQALEREA